MLKQDMSTKDLSPIMPAASAREAPLLESLMRVRRLIYLQAVHSLKPLGVGPKQASILRHMKRLTPSCCLVDLSKSTASDPAAVGRIVDGLVRKGWIKPAPASPDRRRREVSLTPEGRRMADRADAIFMQVDRVMAATLSIEDGRSLTHLLNSMAERLG